MDFFSRSLGINLYRVEVIRSARNRIYTCDKVSLKSKRVRKKRDDDCFFQCYFNVKWNDIMQHENVNINLHTQQVVIKVSLGIESETTTDDETWIEVVIVWYVLLCFCQIFFSFCVLPRWRFYFVHSFYAYIRSRRKKGIKNYSHRDDDNDDYDDDDDDICIKQAQSY